MGHETEKRSTSNESITALLEALRGHRPDAAWKAFLERYSAQMMHVVRQRQYSAQMADDCFLFVCERLSDDGFGRLHQFDPARGVGFRSWLKAVTANLCVEWHRREFGRERIPTSIERLSDFDQQVFRYRYMQDLGVQTCFELLREDLPDLTREVLSAALARVQNALSWRQRWSLLRQRGRHAPLAKGQLSVFELPDRGPNPERLATIDERRTRLRRALDNLQPEERLLLRLRFGQALSLEQVARVAGLPNLHMARRRIEATLARLAETFADDEIS